MTVVEDPPLSVAPSRSAHERWRASLAPVERDVAALLAGGRREAQIAEALALSLQSVERYIVALAHSAGVRERGALVAYARYAGLTGGHDA